MGMDTLKEDLMEWIADTVCMNVIDGDCELDKSIVHDAIMQEMDSLEDDMHDRVDEIMEIAKRMIEESE